MRTEHLEVLVEEPSMEHFLRGLLPRLLMGRASFEVHAYQGKNDLLRKLPERLRGYANWLPLSWRIMVVIDQDEDRCMDLKRKMDKFATDAGLSTRSISQEWRVVNRIAIEELEAWYFGDWNAVRCVYPRVKASIPEQKSFRDSDAILGGTWEAFERVIQSVGYFKSGLAKVQIARELGKIIDPAQNRSHSFRCFRDALLESVQ
jgi:hypothetical protein